MTIVGLLLIVIGMFIALGSSFAYNGQWLLGFIIALAGVALAWHDRKDK
jgi:uncharacterized membrane protein